MSLQLTLHTSPEVPLEAEVLTPEALDSLKPAGVSALTLRHGNEAVNVGEFFRVSGSADEELRVEGELGMVKLLGAGMQKGRLLIDGHVGMHLGVNMAGGEIRVTGNAGDWVGPHMIGGRIVVEGSAGHMIGSAYRGSPKGMLGGEIVIHGDIGNEAGNAMRRGLIAIGGNSGDFTGVNKIAGSIIVLGQLGTRTGAGMKRGTIVSMRDAELLPTFSFACRYRPLFLDFYLRHLRKLGLTIDESWLGARYRRWSGDSIEFNRGEVLLLDQ